MTLLQLLNVTQKYFREKGIESARLDAELLMCHALELDRVGLYLAYDRPMLETEVQAYRELVRRRGMREPVAYITHRRCFWTLDLHIDTGVLIPRPETEVLVERALEFLASRDDAGLRVLDIGTGSGAIALSLASEMEHLDIVALDACAKAVACARFNAENLGFAAQVRVVQGDFPEACARDAGCYDLIVSNPPYIPSGGIACLAPEISQYEPRDALDGGADGLEVYRRWIASCARLLAPGGALMFETGHDQGSAVSALLAANGNFTGIEVARDYARFERVVMCRRA